MKVQSFQACKSLFYPGEEAKVDLGGSEQDPASMIKELGL
jgi:hypothetical protein